MITVPQDKIITVKDGYYGKTVYQYVGSIDIYGKMSFKDYNYYHEKVYPSKLSCGRIIKCEEKDLKKYTGLHIWLSLDRCNVDWAKDNKDHEIMTKFDRKPKTLPIGLSDSELAKWQNNVRRLPSSVYHLESL